MHYCTWSTPTSQFGPTSVYDDVTRERDAIKWVGVRTRPKRYLALGRVVSDSLGPTSLKVNGPQNLLTKYSTFGPKRLGQHTATLVVVEVV